MLLDLVRGDAETGRDRSEILVAEEIRQENLTRDFRQRGDRAGVSVNRRSADVGKTGRIHADPRSEEHTSELQSLMRISYAVFCLKKKTQTKPDITCHYHKTCYRNYGSPSITISTTRRMHPQHTIVTQLQPTPQTTST